MALAEQPGYFGPRLEREALEFEGVTLRIFPLRANPHRLQRFCDDYLNRELPEEIAHFRPAMPYVLLEIINYGRMSPKASNLGWLSQNEIVFAVPLERYRKEGDRWVFVDWATVSPFIFVDDDLSTAEGREIYGWPKIFSSIEAETDPWLEDPRCRRRLLTLSTQMFSELYAGKRLEMRPLLQIEQRLPEAASQWAPDLSYLARPLLGPGSAAMEALGALSDLWLSSVERWRELGDPGVGLLRSALGRGARLPPPALSGSTINLKQFRGGQPGSVCYQALVEAPIIFRKVHGGGPLGDVELLRGDLSGGFTIRLHRHPAYPIIESLGLNVAREERGSGDRIALLEPLSPSWIKADMRYEMGKRLAWRIESETWLTEEAGAEGGEPRRRAPRRNAAAAASAGSSARPPYNTTLGPVAATAQEPFDFWDATVHALLLKARSETLQEFITSRLTLPASIGEVSLMPPYRPSQPDQKEGELDSSWSGDGYDSYAPVILQVSSYGAMSSGANDIGRWAEREVGLAVPVWLQLKGNDKPLPVLFWAYVFSDSPIAVRTDREVTGMPTVQAHIRGGLDPWVDAPRAARRLLGVTVGAYPALHVGARREQKLLLEIHGAPQPAAPRAPDAVDEGFDTLISRRSRRPELEREDINRSVLYGPDASVEAGGLELDHLTVKQFRDAERPHLACYQAVVAARTFIGKWHRPGSAARVDADPTSYRVLLHEYESHPIATELGLCASPPQLAEDGSRVVELQPYPFMSGDQEVSAFSMVVDMRHHLSRTLCWRGVGSPDWTVDRSGLAYMQERTGKHLESIDSFGKFFEALRESVDGASGLGGH